MKIWLLLIVEELRLFKSKSFPKLNKIDSSKTHLVTVGLGGNMGNVIQRFEQLYIYLNKLNNFDIIETSPILENPPFGFLDQKKFFNALVVLKTNLNPTQTLKRLLRIERKFKRKREFKNSPRTLDLDIIFFDNISVNKKDLIIPHSDFKNRDSVLIPLSLLKGRM